MCNPRRVTTTATRDLAEAWHREVTRTVGLRSRVVGEARVSQSLAASLGTPALRALEAALASGEPGWGEVEGGYRRDVEGGYVFYSVDDQALEIVAELAEDVEAEGKVTEVITGEVRDTVSVEGEGRYYDDGWGGRTEEHALGDARRNAESALDAAARLRVERDQREAEANADPALRARAEATAREALGRAAAARRAALELRAADLLEAVGLRGRQVFHSLLARAYREAILAYARRNGAGGLTCRQNGDSFEIEFRVQR